MCTPKPQLPGVTLRGQRPEAQWWEGPPSPRKRSKFTFRNSKREIAGGGGLALAWVPQRQAEHWQLLPSSPLPVKGGGAVPCRSDADGGRERAPGSSWELLGAGPQKALEAGQEEEPASLRKFKGQQKSEAK